MTPKQLEYFMVKHGLGEVQLAEIVGVTPGAINHWLHGTRTMSLTVVRLLKMFDFDPELMKVFAA